ncbi:MAG: hypothetical protein ACMG6S_19945 [Byssovorax sp.]
MLIHIDGSAVTDATSGSATAGRSHTCIENLLLAHFEGNHIVSLLPDDAATLRAVPWSDRARRALDHAEENYSQIAGLRGDISWSLELGLGPIFEAAAAEESNGKTVLRAPIHRFERVHTTACSALLGENLTDAELFREFGLMRRADRRWEDVEMIHEPDGTGGSTFAPTYKQVADRGKILLAIADTDRRHPTSGVGDTYRKLEGEASGRPSYQRARALHTRTAEALVPLPVYLEAFQASHHHDDAHIQGIVARLEQLLRSAPAEMRHHADFKRGITLYQIHNPKTEAEGTYWRGIAETARRDQCSLPTAKECTKREECRCYVVDGLGDHALSDALAWLQNQRSKRRLAERFGLSQNAELTALAEEVLAWGLALSPVMT